MDNQNNNEPSIDVEKDGTQYIKAIEELKANTVEKEKYEALQNENKQLLDALINGSQIELPGKDDSVDVAALRKELFDHNGQLSNLDYATKAVQLRDAIIDQGGVDPFLPIGKNISPTVEDVTKAARVAEALKSCIEYAAGDSQIFTQELMRITNDAMPRMRMSK